ncbi:autophagy-related 2 isoform a [Anaeramoeba flamelloides]|uniref:Autophagy-related protein 2 n=1 Tax=Anaeramoeba flamelloides TaxID=1746091 RepID=A0AAV7ZDW4_9EUKA|nr:autophagy-related 2 isoform a [Anaeramoeba flamelloides]
MSNIQLIDIYPNHYHLGKKYETRVLIHKVKNNQFKETKSKVLTGMVLMKTIQTFLGKKLNFNEITVDICLEDLNFLHVIGTDWQERLIQLFISPFDKVSNDDSYTENGNDRGNDNDDYNDNQVNNNKQKKLNKSTLILLNFDLKNINFELNPKLFPTSIILCIEQINATQKIVNSTTNTPIKINCSTAKLYIKDKSSIPNIKLNKRNEQSFYKTHGYVEIVKLKNIMLSLIINQELENSSKLTFTLNNGSCIIGLCSDSFKNILELIDHLGNNFDIPKKFRKEQNIIIQSINENEQEFEKIKPYNKMKKTVNNVEINFNKENNINIIEIENENENENENETENENENEIDQEKITNKQDIELQLELQKEIEKGNNDNDNGNGNNDDNINHEEDDIKTVIHENYFIKWKNKKKFENIQIDDRDYLMKNHCDINFIKKMKGSSIFEINSFHLKVKLFDGYDFLDQQKKKQSIFSNNNDNNQIQGNGNGKGEENPKQNKVNNKTKIKNKKLKFRDQEHYILLKLLVTNSKIVTFPKNSIKKLLFDGQIKDLKLQHHLYEKYLKILKYRSSVQTRDEYKSILGVKFVIVRPDPNNKNQNLNATEEMRIEVTSSPLRANIDLRVISFFNKFFNYSDLGDDQNLQNEDNQNKNKKNKKNKKSKKIVEKKNKDTNNGGGNNLENDNESVDPIFIQSFKIEPVEAQITLNIPNPIIDIPFENIELKLPQFQEFGVSGFEQLAKQLIDFYSGIVLKKWKIMKLTFGSIPGLVSVKNIGVALSHVVINPFHAYQNDDNVQKALLQNSTKFIGSIIEEALRLQLSVVLQTQRILDGIDWIVTGEKTKSTNKMRSNEPKDISEGLSEAKEHFINEMKEIINSKNRENPLLKVIEKGGNLIIKPVKGVVGASYSTMKGFSNKIDPERRMEEQDRDYRLKKKKKKKKGNKGTVMNKDEEEDKKENHRDLKKKKKK